MEVQRSIAEVGHQDLIRIPPDGKEGHLLRGIVGYPLADHDKPIGLGPTVWLIGKLGGGHLVVAGRGGVGQPGQLEFDRPGDPGHEDKPSPVSLDYLDHRVIEESLVGSDPQLAHCFGHSKERFLP